MCAKSSGAQVISECIKFKTLATASRSAHSDRDWIIDAGFSPAFFAIVFFSAVNPKEPAWFHQASINKIERR
jgi:hypothetical protein